MNLSQFEVLTALVETGSFAAAAERVGLTRSAVSHSLASLEAELGVSLLERERGNAVPTAAGSSILRYARDILSNVEAIQQEAAASRGLQTGKLRVGMVSSISSGLLTGILRKFSQEYPGIELVTFEGMGSEVEAWILNGAVDVGFVLRDTAGIDSLFIGCDEVQVVIPAPHVLHKRRTVTLAKITQEPFVMPKIACDFLHPLQSAADHIELKQRYEATDVQTILAMVREGLGLTLLPSMLLPNQLDGLHLLSLDPPLRFRFGMGVRAQRSLPPAARIFIQLAQSWAESNGFRYEEDLRAEDASDVELSHLIGQF